MANCSRLKRITNMMRLLLHSMKMRLLLGPQHMFYLFVAEAEAHQRFPINEFLDWQSK